MPASVARGKRNKTTKPAKGGQPRSTSKYRNVRVKLGGATFDSQKEAKRCMELLFLRKLGVIYALERSVPFPLEVNGMKVATYICDFMYRNKDGNLIVEDVKGFRTPMYRLKRKLMRACYGIDILET